VTEKSEEWLAPPLGAISSSRKEIYVYIYIDSLGYYYLDLPFRG